MTQAVDWNAARQRLETVTTDPAVLAAFDAIRETGDIGEPFMRAVIERDVSLDWLFFGKEPVQH